ncbi:MAG: hypothetical protein M3Z85_11820, partial [Acidobacteriota bacterium]|nr:hypothetical protein [Acidobacteriota bacterium]
MRNRLEDWKFGIRLLLLAVASAILLPAQHAPLDEAWELLGKGARVEAIRVLGQILEADSGHAEAHLMLGSILAEDGKRTESIVQLNEA